VTSSDSSWPHERALAQSDTVCLSSPCPVRGKTNWPCSVGPPSPTKRRPEPCPLLVLDTTPSGTVPAKPDCGIPRAVMQWRASYGSPSLCVPAPRALSRVAGVGVEYWFWPPRRLPPAGVRPLPGTQLPNPLKEQRAAPRSFGVVLMKTRCFRLAPALLCLGLLGIAACNSNSGPPLSTDVAKGRARDPAISPD
jgi:hypothetical protein